MARRLRNLILANPPQESGYAYMTGMIPPLNLLSLATTLKYNLTDMELNILDGEFLTQEEMTARVLSSTADALGIGIHFFNVKNSIDFLKKAKNKGMTIIVGGYHVNGHALELMRQVPEIDFAVVGEGENALLKLVKGEDLNSIPNLIYRESSSIEVNCIKDPVTGEPLLDEHGKLMPAEVLNLDAVPPPDYSLIENLDFYINNFEKAYPGLKVPMPIYTHKGCVWREKTGGCIFCDCPDKNYRTKSPKVVWKEINDLNAKYGAMFIRDVGDDITADTNWLRELLKHRPSHLSNIGFFAYSRVGKLAKDMEVLSLLADLNVKGLFVGFESGSSKSLRTLNKGVTAGQNYKCLYNISKTDINVFTSFVLGAPEEIEEDLAQTVALAFDIHEMLGTKLKMMNFGILLPYPGTEAFGRLSLIYPEMAREIIFDPESIQKKWVENFCKYSSPDIYKRIRSLCKVINNFGEVKFSFFDYDRDEAVEDKAWVEEIIEKSSKYRKTVTIEQRQRYGKL